MRFFPAREEAVKRTSLPLVAKCGACKLHRSAACGKQPVDGKGRTKTLIIGQSPGETEDKVGRPFVGKAGKFLQEILQELGHDLRQDFWITNALVCWPGKEEVKERGRTFFKNRTPTDLEVGYCRPNVFRAIEELQPEKIILLGNEAIESVLGGVWKPNLGGPMKWSGMEIPLQKWNAWILPTFHPSFVMREDEKDNPKEGQVRRVIFTKHLRRFLEIRGRPWRKLPDHASRARIEFDHHKAAEAVRGITGSNLLSAFDFESNMLKPDNKEGEIVSCAIATDGATISYPWVGEAVTATLEYLRSPVRKAGWNFKHELRWCLRKLGVWADNLVADGMLLAHALDNRPGICSLEFQELLVLGMVPHKEDMKRYLQADGSNKVNRIRQAPLDKLLKYNCQDAIATLEIVKKQAEKLGMEL